MLCWTQIWIIARMIQENSWINWWDWFAWNKININFVDDTHLLITYQSMFRFGDSTCSRNWSCRYFWCYNHDCKKSMMSYTSQNQQRRLPQRSYWSKHSYCKNSHDMHSRYNRLNVCIWISRHIRRHYSPICLASKNRSFRNSHLGHERIWLGA